MNFRREKKATGPTLTKFFVMDGTGATVGVINVANEQAADLQKHWHAPQAAPAARKTDSHAALVSALRKGPRLSKAALLRS